MGDPSTDNPYDVAEFRLSYATVWEGVTVNIGDSRSNNGFSGDGATQSNDAEVEIGFPIGTGQSTVFNANTLNIHGNDAFPGVPAGPRDAPVLVPPIDFLGGAQPTVEIAIADGFVGWSNGTGEAGSLNSPFLYALAGQADSEGPVNYDIFAGFNRVVSSTSRYGFGLDVATVCLRAAGDRPCFAAAVPEPASIALLGGGLASLLLGLRRRRGGGKLTQVNSIVQGSDMVRVVI